MGESASDALVRTVERRREALRRATSAIREDLGSGEPPPKLVRLNLRGQFRPAIGQEGGWRRGRPRGGDDAIRIEPLANDSVKQVLRSWVAHAGKAQESRILAKRLSKPSTSGTKWVLLEA